MSARLFLLVLVCLFSSSIVFSQPVFSVDESKLTGVFKDKWLKVDMPVRSVRRVENVNARVEIVDEYDTPVAKSDTMHNLTAGPQRLTIPISSLLVKADKFVFYRLRYSLSQPDSPNTISSTVALSEITPEIFELQVTAPENVFAGMNIRAHVLAVNPFTKKPIRNVDISGTVELDVIAAGDDDEDEIELVSRGRTNDEGIATLAFNIPQGTKLDDDGDLTIEGSKNGILRTASADLDVSANSFVYLYTDKPIYQPGQKLYIRGLYLNDARRPEAGKELEIEIENEENDTVLEKTVVTSRFGVASIEWQIPADFKLGKYSIKVENDDSDDIGKAEFKVSRYDLPNFTVNAKPDKSFYLLNETSAQVTVDASYLFGKSVQAGKVKIVEERERSWNYYKQEYDTDVGTVYEGETDNEGKFRAAVNLDEAVSRLKNEQWKRFTDVRFAAYFTDATTNRTEQKRFDIRISREPIHIYFIRPAADLNPAIPFQFYISAFYPDGSPAKTDLKVSGHYSYNTNKDEILAEGRSNAYGAAKFEFKLPAKPFAEVSDRFNLRIIATDKDGKTGSFNENLDVFKGRRQIRIKTDRTIYVPGQPISAKILSSSDVSLFVDVAKNSSVIWSKQVSVRKGSATVLIPYRPDFKGELAINAYFFDDDGDIDERKVAVRSVLYPSPADLSLNLKAVKNVYRPGEDARLAFNVRNGSGAGAESALGIVMLDKAIEERARVEQLPDNMSDVRKLLGTAEAFGDLTRRDLDNLDTTKPISSDLQLAAEYLLANRSCRPRSFSSYSYRHEFSSVYQTRMRARVEPLFEALRRQYRDTGEFPDNAADLASQASRAGIDINTIRDAWDVPFHANIRRDRGDVVIEMRSASADKKTGTDDDFFIGDIRFQWFTPTLNKIRNATGIERADGPKPKTADEMKVLITNAGIDLEAVKDESGRPVHLATAQTFTRNSLKSYLETVGNLDGARQQVMRTTAVQQEVALHSFTSPGRDGIPGSWDDLPLGSLVVVLSEKEISTESGKVTLSKAATASNRGAIGGTITDQNGAVIAGAKIKATNIGSGESFDAESNPDGIFLVANLPSGRYGLRAEASYFQASIVENIVVSAYNLVKVDMSLEVGSVSATVEVTGARIEALNLSSSSISRTVTKTDTRSIAGMLGGNQPGQTFTPRVREYFPETLVWQPELITDRNGRASFDFKMADSLTTWKLYAFGSTESGEFGFVEKEIQTFQPFFAELDPPKILTEGDEISLPVPIRNYTDKRQRVAVSMEQNEWSKMPNGGSKQIEIAPNSSQNAVFDFVASTPVKDGKQKVTALTGAEGDAIEKPVTVKPNGREEIKVQSATFQGTTAFDVNFPADAFPANRSATLKIYPNMLAHVAESVEGLLQRPHGCGEQTTSSTYPNLMILKIEKDFGKPLDANLKTQAKTYLADGYKRLLNYQTPSGGFSYWGPSDTPNPALTAYIIRFLSDAEEFIETDESVVTRARQWLANQQRPDGSWTSYGSPDGSTAYIVRSLLHTEEKDPAQLQRINAGLAFLEKRLDESGDAYVFANTALIATKLGNIAVASKAVQKLIESSKTKDEQTSWPAASTPFYGWGRTAELETTAIAVQALNEVQKSNAVGLSNIGTLIAGGLRFLLANKDQHGVWFSTQTTVNVLNTLIGIQKGTSNGTGDQKLAVLVNGMVVKEFALSAVSFTEPIRIDLGPSLNQNNNRIEIKGAGQSVVGAHLVVNYYSDWATAQPESRYFDLKVSYDKTTAKIGEEISCSVEMRRKSYTRHGMVLTEIGLPPGADVDRTMLEAAKARKGFSSYDILPDKVLVYSWNAAEPLAFSFKFKHRYGINAQTAPSVVYDYYNPEAQATAAPVRFNIR